jgi:hypothetical protein
LDLKTGTGAVGKGEPPSGADATLTMHSKDFADMFAGLFKKFKFYRMEDNKRFNL